MKKSLGWNALIIAACLSGCATMAGDQGARLSSGIQVTRFHLGQPIARGEIRVEPADPAMARDAGFAPITASVERELRRLGWNVEPAKANTEQVAVVRVTQSNPPSGSVLTELAVRIQRRSDATVAWEGRAQTETRAISSMTDRSGIIGRLAEAMFRDFPGESGRTIRVR